MQIAIFVLVVIQTTVDLVELGILIDKQFKQAVEDDLGVPEEDREP